MASDRVLVEIVTAANMSGIREAQAGFLGMSNALSVAIAGLGIMVVAGKSAVDIAERHEKAERDLAQAISARGGDLNEATKFLDDFISSNRQYIKDQAEVIDAYAALLRAGVPVAEAQRDLNRILDISAIKGRDVADVTQQIIMAEHGRLKGLSDLGVTTTKFTDAEGNQVASSHDVAKAFGEVDVASKHGRDSLTETDKASRALGNDWQDIANNVGPPLIGMLDGILRLADWLVHKLKELGQDRNWNDALYYGFGRVQEVALDFVAAIRAIIDGIKWLIDNGGRVANFLGGSSGGGGRHVGPRGVIYGATGFEGSVSQPTLFMAGEAGTEDVSIRPQGGGGGHTINLNFYGTVVSNPQELSRMLAHELRLTGAFR